MRKNKLLKWIVRQLPSGQAENLPVTSEELLISIAIGDEAMVRKLLEAGVDPNKGDHMGRLPLQLAVKSSLPNSIKWLVFAGADINMKDEEEQNALFIALQKNAIESGRELLRLGIDMDARDLNNNRVIDLAKEKNNLAFIELLEYFQTARRKQQEHSTREQAKKFNGLDLDLPLLPHQISEEELRVQEDIDSKKTERIDKAKSAYQERLEKARKFASRKKIVSVEKPPKNKILDAKEIAKQLGFPGKRRDYTLIQAIRQHKNDLMKTLLATGISLERLEPQTLMTPLAAAVVYKNQDAIDYLLALGAQADSVYRGHSLLFYAVRIGETDIAKTLLEAGCHAEGKPDTPTPLCLAVKKNYPDLCRLLLEEGAKINCVQNKTTALKILIAHGRKSMLPLFEEYGADLNCSEATGRSSLSWAMLFKKMNIFSALLDAGADINAGREKGESILSQCIRSGDATFLDKILKEGADVNIIDSYKRTPLTLAIQENRPEIVRKLLEAGADINMMDGEGRTAPEMAKKLKGRERICAMLIP